jgi:dipeptidyl aminopeptidase/acylaminoacyl peptidase
MSNSLTGGPEGAWDDAWSYRWNPQLWASAGFVTIAVNPRGSSGFGQAYQDAVALDWGGQPYLDLMTGNSYILQKYPNIDPKRMAACGASYGGFMINWIMYVTKANRHRLIRPLSRF